jgi:NTE family protein
MAHYLTEEEALIPIVKRGQALIDRLHAGDQQPLLKPENGSMPRIGVALGGGSARGLTHIPFIEAMDELGLKPSVIAGTSIGALIGSGWANGMSGRELREHAMSVLGTLRIIAARIWGRRQIRNLGGLVQNGFNLQLDANRIVDAFLPDDFPDQFAELQVPLYVVATDFQSWHQAVFNTGLLRPTIAGSIAIPSFFKPVSFANHLLVDGGVVNPLPLDQASADADILVGIDVNGDPSDRLKRDAFTALDVWFGSAQIMMHSLTAHMMAAYPPDVYARPHVNAFGAMEFWRVKEILEVADKEKDHFKRNLSRKVEQFLMKSGEITRAGD